MSIQPFAFKGHEVRVVLTDNGEPRWVAADVAEILGYRDAANMCRGLRERNRGTHSVSTPSGEQNMTTINEPGLYQAVLKSRRPEAEEFQDWVTDEVLPSIRKTGSYGAPALSGKELMAAALVEAQATMQAMEAKTKELEPKADAYDSFMDATGKYSVGAVAQMLGWGQNKLFQELRNRKIFIASGSRRNTPYQHYAHHFEVIAHEFEKKNGDMGCSYTTYVQPSGIDFIRKKMGIDRIDPVIAAAEGVTA